MADTFGQDIEDLRVGLGDTLLPGNDDVLEQGQEVKAPASHREQFHRPVRQAVERYAGRVQLTQNLDGVLDHSH